VALSARVGLQHVEAVLQFFKLLLPFGLSMA
jgi:hypothetical protein